MVLNRRQFGATAIGSAAALWATPLIAQGKKVSLKVGGQFADSHPSSKAMEEACADIRRQSEGRIDIQFFPSAQLGSDAAMLTQVRSGALDMMTASGISMQVVSPIAGISGMAFAFSDYASRLAGDGWRSRRRHPRRPGQGRHLRLSQDPR